MLRTGTTGTAAIRGSSPSGEPQNAIHRVAGLDLMRACAISLVIFHHLLGLVMDRYPWMHVFSNSGPLGVDIFFGLSGFLIGRILLGLGRSIAEPRVLLGFWCRRWMRTLPLYYVILGVCVAWAYARNGHGAEIIRASSPYLWFGQSLTSRPPFFFGESWSLAVEEWFYLLFPLAWACSIRLGARTAVGYATCAMLMLAVPMALRLHLDPGVQRLWYYDVAMITIYRFDSIAMGVIAAALSLWKPELWRRCGSAAFILGLVLLGADWVCLVNPALRSEGYMLVWHFTVTGLGCALLLPLLSALGSFSWQPLARAATTLALLSYPLYLVNSLVLSVVRFYSYNHVASSAGWSWALLVIELAASVALAAGLHKWIEKPIMDLRRRLPEIRSPD